MTISKSLPINFWLTSDPTYNDDELCGIYSECFCEHVNYDEEITLQFNHSSALTLSILNYQTGATLNSVSMTSLGGGYYQYTFKPNVFANNDDVKVVKFIVTETSGSVQVAKSSCVVIGGCIDYGDVPLLSEATTGWSDRGGGLIAFNSKSGDVFTATSMPRFDIYSAYKAVNVPISKQITDPDTLILSITADNPGGRLIHIRIRYWTTGFGAIVFESEVIKGTNGTSMHSFGFVRRSTNNIAIIEVSAFWDTGGVSIYDPTISISLPTGTELWNFGAYYSRCYDLDCSKTILYTNTKNFDNFLYDQSPVITNQIVIPAQFEVEDEPTEQTNAELSDGEIVMLRQRIVTKQLLKFGFMPNYMHKKLRRILMHDTVRIEGTEDGQVSYWRMLDAYETTPVNKYGLKQGQVWLTLYNSIEKNTL